MDTIFQNYNMQDLTLQNRILMAPMTRSRAKNGIVTDLNATYYSQRASAGLIISEATQISLQGQGYADTPAIYTQEHIKAWQKVTKAIHDKGGKIFLQLWHVGRVSSSKVNNMQPVAPSSIIAKDTSVYVFENEKSKDAVMIPVDTPKAMDDNDIQNVINDFKQAGLNAMEAGFDGVEIHGANGYLLDQFLRSNSNVREDKYGGSKENRTRLIIDITKEVIKAIGSTKVGIRLSPFIKFKDMHDEEILDTFMIVASELEKLNIAYIHLCEADWDDAPDIPLSFRKELRSIFKNTIISTGGYDLSKAKKIIKDNLVDIVGFGRYFIPNPDLVERFKNNQKLSSIKDSHTLFGGRDHIGYTDYQNFKDI